MLNKWLWAALVALLICSPASAQVGLQFRSSPVPSPYLDDNGWTVFPATPITSGSCAAGTANGSCTYYASTSGSDTANDCLDIKTPCQTPSYLIGKLRNGFPDRALFKCADTWTDMQPGTVTKSGRSRYELMMIGSYTVASGSTPDPYDCSARPKFNVNTSPNPDGIACIGSQGADTNFSFVAVVGLWCNAYTRDPSDGGFSTPSIDAQAAQIVTNPYYQYWENNKFTWFVGSNISPVAPIYNQNIVVWRRNIVTDSYAQTSVHSVGLFATGNTFNVTIEDSYFARNGYSASLFAPATVTIDIPTSTVTWTGNHLFNSDNGTTSKGTEVIFTATTGSLPTPLALNTRYWVVNHSGNTFKLATNTGEIIDPAMTLSGTQSGVHTMRWATVGPDPLRHNLYINEGDEGKRYPATVNTSIFADASANAIRGPSAGGTVFNNLMVRNPIGFFVAFNSSSISYNVVTEGTRILLGNGGPEGFVVQLQPDPSTTIAEYNIVAHRSNPLQDDLGILLNTDVNGAIIRNNIVCDWDLTLTDNSGKTNTWTNNIGNVSTCSGTWGAVGLGVAHPVPFTDPTRSVGSYNGTLGGTATTDGFLAAVEAQFSKPLWNPAYMANPVNNYIRQGFDMPNAP